MEEKRSEEEPAVSQPLLARVDLLEDIVGEVVGLLEPEPLCPEGKTELAWVLVVES